VSIVKTSFRLFTKSAKKVEPVLVEEQNEQYDADESSTSVHALFRDSDNEIVNPEDSA
jgi:hypothetical protein